MMELVKALGIIAISIGLHFAGLSETGAWALVIIYFIWITRQQH
jgi:hypothetical protein